MNVKINYAITFKKNVSLISVNGKMRRVCSQWRKAEGVKVEMRVIWNAWGLDGYSKGK